LGGERKAGGGIVIGTQTLEQSLDIDADLLITDLCPVDVLLQRLGRLHRHTRDNRANGFQEPKAYVITPDEESLDVLINQVRLGLGKPADGKSVYPDIVVLQNTLNMIRQRPCWHIPEMNRFLIEEVLHSQSRGDLMSSMGDKWQEVGQSLTGQKISDRFVGGLGLLQRQRDRAVKTRLGESACCFEFSVDQPGPFGEQFKTFSLPGWMVSDAQVDSVVVEDSADLDQLAFSVGDDNFVYSRFGFEKLQ